MERKTLHSSLLKSAGYDNGQQRLELEFADGSIRVFKAVPTEVFRRLIAAPNPASYYEDRIAEEYAWSRTSQAASGDARSKLDDLFGGGKP